MATGKDNGFKEFQGDKTTEGHQGEFIGFKLGFDPLKKADLVDAELHKECKRVRNLSAIDSSLPTRSCECCGLPLVPFHTGRTVVSPLHTCHRTQRLRPWLPSVLLVHQVFVLRALCYVRKG